MVVQIKRNFQLTLPAHLRRQLDIKIGDFIDIIASSGKITLVPKKMIDAEQVWFWSKEWQMAEKEAESDIKHGKVKKFKSAQDLIKDLDK